MPYENPAIKTHGIAWCVLLMTLALLKGVAAQAPGPSPSLKKCWEYPAAELNERGAMADSVAVYLSEHGGRVEAVSAANGSKLWFSDLGGEITSNIVGSENAIFVVTRSAGQTNAGKPKSVLRSLSKTTGITNWVAEISDSESAFLGISKGNVTVVSALGIVSSLSAVNGAARWTVNLNSKVSVEPDFAADSILAATDKDILAISADTGSFFFKKAVPYRPTAVGMAGEGKAAWGDERGNLFLFDTAAQKKIWKFKQGGAVSNIDGLGETLLVTSNDNFAYSVALYNGNVRWKRRQPDRTYRPELLSDERIILSSRSGTSSTVLEKGHGKVVDNITFGSNETLTQSPAAGGGKIFFAGVNGITAYSPGGCQAR